MRWLAPPELGFRPARAAMLGNAARLCAGLSLLVAMCLVTSIVLLAAGLLLPPPRRGPFARRMTSAMFRLHLGAMSGIGGLQLDLGALDALRGAPGMVIAPNHPSMIDAGLLLSRLPDLTCVMKADILANPLFGSGARMGGYITNHPPRSMLRAAVGRLREGRHLLLFPEGTRTVQPQLNPLQRTVGVIARHAGVPVQTVIIEASSAFLGKGWPLSRIPSMPIIYKARLGRRFDAPTDADAFTAELEAYFRRELAGARLPVLPVHADSR
jgi:1-acyl-sn-glycerol-3-phosphate acyltransferase